MKTPAFTVGQLVRYKPGYGTYGYEDSLEADGRIPGTVTGFTATRVRVTLRLLVAGRRISKSATVDASSLRPHEG